MTATRSSDTGTKFEFAFASLILCSAVALTSNSGFCSPTATQMAVCTSFKNARFVLPAPWIL